MLRYQVKKDVGILLWLVPKIGIKGNSWKLYKIAFLIITTQLLEGIHPTCQLLPRNY